MHGVGGGGGGGSLSTRLGLYPGLASGRLPLELVGCSVDVGTKTDKNVIMLLLNLECGTVFT